MGDRIFTREDAKSIIRTTTDKVKLPSDFTVLGRGSLAGFSQVKELTIPEGVRRISTYTFFTRSFKDTCTIQRLIIPASVKEFEQWCFFGCNALMNVSLPENFPEQQAMELFFHCPEATLGFGKKLLFASKTKIVQQIMDETPGVLTLGSASMLKIDGNGDFAIPSNYSYILPHALKNLSSRGIKRLILPPNMKIIGYRALSFLKDLEEVIISDGTPYIDNYAFLGCKKLRSVVIPDSVAQIGVGAFMNCPSLESVKLPPNLREEHDELFSGCTALTKVSFGNIVGRIGAGAFNECASLREMILPDSVKTIGNSAFWNCSALQRLYIPAGIETISQSALSNCAQLAELYIPDTVLTDKLERGRVFGDQTNPTILPSAFGFTPDWSQPIAARSDSAQSTFMGEDIPEVPSALPPGIQSVLADIRPDAAPAPAQPAPAVDAGTVQQMQQTILAMQAQLSALTQQQNQAAVQQSAPQVDPQMLETLNRNITAMQQQFQAVSALQGSAQTISQMQQQMDSINNMQTRMDELAANQATVQQQMNAISDMQAKVEQISDIHETVGAISNMQGTVDNLQEKIDAISDIQAKVDSISEIQAKVDSIAELQEKVDAISEVQERVSVIPELQQKVAEISEMQSQITDVQNAAETISELQSAAEAISDIQAKVDMISEVQEQVSVIPQLQQQVEAIAEAQNAVTQQAEMPAPAPVPAAVPSVPVPEPVPAAPAAPVSPAEQFFAAAKTAFAGTQTAAHEEAPVPAAVPEPEPAKSAEESAEPAAVVLDTAFSDKIALVPHPENGYGEVEHVFTHEISKSMPGPKERSAALKDYTVIAYRAFRTAEGGERFEIPEGVRRVESQAFWDSPRLLAIELPLSLTQIEPDAFSGCSRIQDIYVKEGYSERLIVESFIFRQDAVVHWPKKNVFSKARTAVIAELTEQFDDILTLAKAKKLEVRSHVLHIPEGYTMIAPGALSNIDPREDEPEHTLKTVFLPRSIRRISAKAFDGLAPCMHIVIPEGLEIVDMNAFTGCVGPYRIVLPDSVRYLGPYAFAAPCQYAQLRLPSTLHSITENTFSNCNTLVSLRIPESVQEIGEAALSGCTGLANLTVPKRFEEQLPLILDGPVKINVDWTEDEKHAYREAPPAELLAVVEPDFAPAGPQRLFTQELSASCANFAERLAALRSHPVIATGALTDMANQTKFEIPLGVLRLCSYAFGHNTRLMTLTVPKALSEFEYASFYGCERLRDVFLPDDFDRACAAVLFMRKPQILISFGSARSVRVRQLTTECPWILSAGDSTELKVKDGTMEIPEGYLVIASFMYHGIDGRAAVRKLHVPSSARIMGTYSIVQMTDLEEIVCENGLRAVEPEAIAQCPNLKRVVLPPSLTFLGVHPFVECPQITSVTIPRAFENRVAEILRECPHAQITWSEDVYPAEPAAAQPEKQIQAVADALFPEPIQTVPEPVTESPAPVQPEVVPAPIQDVAESLFPEPAAPSEPEPAVSEPETPAEPEPIPEPIADMADALFEIVTQPVEPNLEQESEDSVECADLRDLSALEPVSSELTEPDEIGRTADDSLELADIETLGQLDAEPEIPAEPEPAEAPDAEPESIPEITLEPAPAEPEIPAEPEPAEEPAAEPESIPEIVIPEEPAIGTQPEEAEKLLSDIVPDTDLEPVTDEPAIGTEGKEASELLTEIVPETEQNAEPDQENDAAAILEKMELADALGIKLDDEDIVQIMTETPPEWPLRDEHLTPRGELDALPGAEPEPVPDNLPVPADGKFTAKECRERYHGEPEYEIPSGFTEIRAGACAALDDLEKVIIPDSVKKIGSGSFADCASLVQVQIPLSVEEIADDAFEGCEALAVVVMPRALQPQVEGMFSDQVQIHWLESEHAPIIGDGRFTAKIRNKMFDGEGELVIPEGYQEIRAGACAGLEDMTAVSLPKTLTKICSGAFADCTALTSVTILSADVQIEEDAFEGCTALKQITVPQQLADSVRQIFPEAEILAQ